MPGAIGASTMTNYFIRLFEFSADRPLQCRMKKSAADDVHSVVRVHPMKAHVTPDFLKRQYASCLNDFRMVPAGLHPQRAAQLIDKIIGPFCRGEDVAGWSTRIRALEQQFRSRFPAGQLPSWGRSGDRARCK